MKVWDVPVKELCDQHLLAEHGELHAIWSILVNYKDGYRDHPEVKRWEQAFAGLRGLRWRHDSQRNQMHLRGMNHASPLKGGGGPLAPDGSELTRPDHARRGAAAALGREGLPLPGREGGARRTLLSARCGPRTLRQGNVPALSFPQERAPFLLESAHVAQRESAPHRSLARSRFKSARGLEAATRRQERIAMLVKSKNGKVHRTENESDETTECCSTRVRDGWRHKGVGRFSQSDLCGGLR